jgi:hypothetical protein
MQVAKKREKIHIVIIGYKLFIVFADRSYFIKLDETRNSAAAPGRFRDVTICTSFGATSL